MTVSYTGDVANGSSFGCFWKILFRWKASVYKLIWRELIVYLLLYFSINMAYRKCMTESQRDNFEKVKVYCSKQIESIPMSFVLGFYVSLIVKRWWDQYWILPLPDSLALYISASINGQDERGRILRRTIMRYAMLAYIITLQRISFRVKKRFPNLQHLVDSGLMMESEKMIFDKLEARCSVSKFWMPVIWASNLVNRARNEGRICSDHMVQTIQTELSDFRRRLGRVMVYDTVSVPLVYTQVVTLAVYTYFVAALLGRQWVAPLNSADRSRIYPNYELDLIFPFFLALQFIFYIGWLKVAETLINPFGEDDDDFELNWLIDRHIQVSYMVVDTMHEDHPELLKDNYWEQVVPTDLPYNIASEGFRRSEPQGSTASMKIKEKESEYTDLQSVKRHSTVPEDVYADYVKHYDINSFSINSSNNPYESVADSPLVNGKNPNWFTRQLSRQLSRVESFRSTGSSSSLFGRNRSNSQVNGAFPQGYGSQGGRPSLYDRFISRRSSKDQNRPRLSIPQNGKIVLKENISSLMPHPNSRPRVPTPDAIRENSTMNIVPPRQIYTTGPPTTGHVNVQNYNLPSGNVLSEVRQNQSNNSAAPHAPPLTTNSETGSNETCDSSDGNHNNNIILAPIEENDGSPYSTSSTTRSSRSSNYPMSNSIFDRTTEELPPIPVEFRHEIPQGAVVHNPEMVNEERSYMTIAEVNEAKAELEKFNHRTDKEDALNGAGDPEDYAEPAMVKETMFHTENPITVSHKLPPGEFPKEREPGRGNIKKKVENKSQDSSQEFVPKLGKLFKPDGKRFLSETRGFQCKNEKKEDKSPEPTGEGDDKNTWLERNLNNFNIKAESLEKEMLEVKEKKTREQELLLTESGDWKEEKNSKKPPDDDDNSGNNKVVSKDCEVFV